MTVCVVTQNADADYSAQAAALGITLPQISDFDEFPTRGLHAFYDFSEGAGSTVHDLFADRTLQAVNPQWVAGKGLRLDGTGYLVSDLAVAGDFEHLIVMEVTDPATTSIQRTVIGGMVFNVSGVRLLSTSAGSSGNSGLGRLQAQQYNGTGSGTGAQAIDTSTAVSTTNLWRRINWSRSTANIGSDAGANKMRLVVDNGYDSQHATAMTDFVAGGLPWTLGHNSPDGTVIANDGLIATIACWGIWNTRLTPAERAMANLYVGRNILTPRGITLGVQ